MAKFSKVIGLLWGMLLGNIFSFFLLLRYSSDDKINAFTGSMPSFERFRGKDTSHDTNLIMVGVMTAPKYFDTRAKAVYETWGRDVPGDIKFYSSQGSQSMDIPLIALDNVDDSYPPQKKSLMMLKHMHDNYLNSYEWFMRADDDVYVRPDRLEELLRSVDSRKMWFIGQTGRGNSEEFGLLSLDSDENFCMGGPGVIFSRETLKRVAPYVEDCLRHLYTTHEDVELGRCVRKFAGVSCTWSYQMQVIFYHNQSGYSAFTGGFKRKEIHQAITLHPVKQPENLYRLHKYFKSLKIQDIQHDSLNLQRDLLVSISMLGYDNSASQDESVPEINSSLYVERNKSYSNLLKIPASIIRNKASNLEEINEWEFISNSLYSPNDLNPKRRIGSSLKEGIADVIVEVMELINSFSKQRGRLIEFKEILYSYWRLHPVYGVEYILDLLLVYRKYRGHKMTIQVRRHAYVQQTFTALYIREVQRHVDRQYVDSAPVHDKIKHALLNLRNNLPPIFKFDGQFEEETIHFILPLYGRYDVFERFMTVYESVCLIPKEPTSLNIILYRSTNSDEFLKTKVLISSLQTKYYASRISVTFINEIFTRGRALQHGVDMLEDQDLMFFIDVDMVFSRETLTRIRMNVIPYQSIYFPIVFSLYNPKLYDKNYTLQKHRYSPVELLKENNGFWRQFGFGIVSLYKCDYSSIGGLNLMITGWGFEDVTFFDKVIKSDLEIVRAPEPSLVHIYHVIHCDENLDTTQKNMCLGTEASALSSLKYLQTIFLQYKQLFV